MVITLLTTKIREKVGVSSGVKQKIWFGRPLGRGSDGLWADGLGPAQATGPIIIQVSS